MQTILVGLGAGIASALLFIALASGSGLALALFYFAPLPIMLAGLGWNHFAALLATLTAAGGIGIGAGFWFAIAYLAGIGVPAYTLIYLAMLGRTAANGSMEWFPPGRIVTATAVLATIAMALTVPVFGTDIDSYRDGLKEIFGRVLRAQLAIPEGKPLELPNGTNVNRTLDVLSYVMPPLASAVSMITLLINMYIAGRVARASGRLSRPWPDLSQTALPFSTPLLLLTAFALSFLHSIAGLAGGVLTACLLMAYAIVGLSVLHAITRGNPLRSLILGAAWAVLIVLGWPIVLLALLGLADGLFNLRGRSGPPNSQPTQI